VHGKHELPRRSCSGATAKREAEDGERPGEAPRALGTNRQQVGQVLGERALRACRDIAKEPPDTQEQAHRLVTDGQIARMARRGAVDARGRDGTARATRSGAGRMRLDKQGAVLDLHAINGEARQRE
jgi:hypothetical protein